MSATADVVAPHDLEGERVLRPRWWTAVVRRPAGAAAVAVVTAVVILGVVGPWLAPHDPLSVASPSLVDPSWEHPLGTDALGRDVFSAVLHGLRTSLVVAGGVATIVVVVGVVLGMVAGYRAGLVDDVLMRSTELVQVLPRFFLAIVVIALFGPGLDNLVVVLGLTSWPVLARVVRAEVLSLREREFVEAARADGASAARIVLRELLPGIVPSVVVLVGLLAAQAMLVEASLAFLGLGDPNVVSLGYLAAQGQGLLRVAWWVAIFPGLTIAVAVLGLNLLGDAVTDALGERR